MSTLIIKVNDKEIDRVETSREVGAVIVAPLKGNESILKRLNLTNDRIAKIKKTGYIKLRLSKNEALAKKGIHELEKMGYIDCFVTKEVEKLLKNYIPIKLIPR